MLKRSLIALGALVVGTACSDAITPSAPAGVAPPLAPSGALLASRGVPRAGH
jgi:hypothetical protein